MTEASQHSAPAATIRVAQPADAPAIARLHAASMAKPWTAPEWRDRLGDDHIRCLIAEGGAEAVGFLAIRQVADEAEVLLIAVLPRVRRHGFARTLMQQATADLARGPTRCLFLEVSVLNHAALALYSEFGFQEVGKRAAYYHVPGKAPQDALILALDLDNTSHAPGR